MPKMHGPCAPHSTPSLKAGRCRHTVAEAPQQLDAEQRRQELLQAAIDAPTTTQQGLSSDVQQGDCAAASAQGEGPAEAMAVDLPE